MGSGFVPFGKLLISFAKWAFRYSGWGTWIRTKTNRVRVLYQTLFSLDKFDVVLRPCSRLCILETPISVEPGADVS